ncbi:2-oxo acid dehydrogenase subunit E2 [Chitinophaga polysaccharea]|uniref:dihydrolipoamide acetyltransferase family protein n=1 Tax=Chitinophaga polysaccharea TaxID=1293035 RepID=UPI001454FC79|nr:dihydrolipoamide acetyltransferase family protein [Chitinophaga polysaccharea]NLR60787.1 2-oxo acid dehydrogenase subunit E2 [Chitinophaga polysaccharea]
MIEFCMPSLGADMEAGTLREWLVKPGDTVKRGDIIAVVETQKGLIDIEVFDEGTIDQLVVKEEEKVPVGTLMALIASTKEAVVKPEQQEVKTAEKIIPVPLTTTVKASPLARRVAAEKGVDLAGIKGTGEGGAITKEDVEKAAAAQKEPVKEEQPTMAAEGIRMAVAAAMSKSNREIPHYYLETKVDMTLPLAWLSEANKKRTVKQRLLPVVLLVKAVAKALADVPDLNAYWDNGLQRKDVINIGFAISLRTGGVMIPAIHLADKKTLDELMASLNDMIPRARAMKLRSSELSDSTITITSLGEGNVETVYGVIYPPQVALVGFGSIIEQPWAEQGMLGVRPILTVTLAADHRATDGATGSRFLVAFNEHLQKPDML